MGFFWAGYYNSWLQSLDLNPLPTGALVLCVPGQSWGFLGGGGGVVMPYQFWHS